jgi:serine/threonine-protein kinase
MNEPHDPNRTVDIPSVPSDSLDAGIAAGFGRAEPGRSSHGAMRPVLLKEAEGESADVVKPKSDAMPPLEQTGDRYQLQGEIARGGMGAVLRGRDVDLGRDLAVKVLLEKYVDRPEVARRFIEEAQIGGQLQHPGVVPVYDIGRFGNRPFFTMKLVKGHTLAALLAERDERHVSNVPDEEARWKRAPQDLSRFLDIALKVAQTLAYAHAKGVIHRDLKPANIMVGAFGEVQVMDWGLAKVLAEGGIADENHASRERQRAEDVTTIRTARSTGSAGSFGTDTEAGSLLGTPAYMPPEQANGDIANLDRRADVFGLGAILCEILTGKPPYVGRSAEEVRRKACNGDLADALARLDSWAADLELIAITKSCLSPEAMDRPRDALAVADGLTAYLDGVQARLHHAELAEAEAKAKAIEEAKRRRLTLALAATVLLALTLGGGGWLFVKVDLDSQQAALTQDVNEALGKALSLREQAKGAMTGGAALLAQAREQAQRALALVENGPADDTLKQQVRQLQAELDEEEKDRALVTALEDARLVQAEALEGKSRYAEERALPKFREALRAYGLTVGEGDPKVAAERIGGRPAAVQEAIVAALDDWDALAANPKLGIDEPHRDWLRAVLETAEPGDGWMRRFRAAREEKDQTRRKTALEKLAAAKEAVTLPARALTRLAAQLDKVDAYSSAAKLLRQAQAKQPADFWVNHNLGLVLRRVTPPERDEAVRFLTTAVALRPHSPGVHSNLGVALQDRGHVDEAIACHRKAVELDPKAALCHSNLGDALRLKGQLEEAIASCRQAIKLDPSFATAHNSLGHALYHEGQVDGAIASYGKAVELDPKAAAYHNNLGVALIRKGRLDEAIASFRKAVALAPKDADTHSNLGGALRNKGRLDEAIACCRKAIEIDPTFANAHYHLGDSLVAQHRFDEAIVAFRTAIKLDSKFPMAHAHLGAALAQKGWTDEAIASCRQAIKLDPKDAGAHSNLGVALASLGKVDEAIACFKKAIDIDPKAALAHSNLGKALQDKGQVDEAIAFYTKAIALDPKFAEPHSALGGVLRDRGQLAEAIASYKMAIALDPKHAAAHKNLGAIFCDRTRDYDEAIACFQKAIAIDPKDAIAHFNLGNALQRKGQLEEAIACYQKAVALGVKHAPVHYCLGNTLRARGKVDEAIACFKNAIEVDPQYAEAHCNLGDVLRSQGRFAESLTACQRGHELGSKRPGWNYPSAKWVRDAERLAALEAKVPAVLEGEIQPRDMKERLQLVAICRAKKLHRSAARLYADAFVAEPKLADFLPGQHRYSAACFAALAAAGQGKDAAKLDGKERARLRKQALDWLRADLALHTKQVESGQPAERAAAQKALRHAQKDSDFDGLRDAAALAKLPAEERTAWAKLWSDVAALLKKVETPVKEEGKR